MFEYPFGHLIAKIPIFLHLQMLFNNKELSVCIMNDLLKIIIIKKYFHVLLQLKKNDVLFTQSH